MYVPNTIGNRLNGKYHKSIMQKHHIDRACHVRLRTLHGLHIELVKILNAVPDSERMLSQSVVTNNRKVLAMSSYDSLLGKLEKRKIKTAIMETRAEIKCLTPILLPPFEDVYEDTPIKKL